MRQLTRFLKAIRPRTVARFDAALESLEASTPAVQDEMVGMRRRVTTLVTQLSHFRRGAETLVEAYRQDVEERARLGRLPEARLLSQSIVLEGLPSARLRVERVIVGGAVERSFGQWMGLTHNASTDPEVRRLWDRLLAAEASCHDDVLRGGPGTVLDVGDGVVSRTESSTLRVSLRDDRSFAPFAQAEAGRQLGAAAVVAVPEFSYHFSSRKLRNFGHWLLDCVPQVVALLSVAPEATFLLPHPMRGFQRATLALVGVRPSQMVPWAGEPVQCERLLVLESDGRAGGGRPLSALVELRRRVSASPRPADAPGSRRIYVTRRDAKANRRWIANETAVENLFRSHGFEILSMAACPLDEQIRIFREAGVVAGVNGAGLADIIFSSPGTHVIVLVSDSLMRWYADERGARSLWMTDDRIAGGQLSALGDSPKFYGYVAAAGEQFSHYFVGADEMPIEPLSGFIGDVLRRVDQS